MLETEIDKIDENNDEIENNKKDYNEQREFLEINPYFLWGKLPFDITKFNNNNNSKIEKKKKKKILNKNKKEHDNNEKNIFIMTTTKNLRKKQV